MESVPSAAELRALRVVDLKQRLAEVGLPQAGLKADLVARLEEHYDKLRHAEDEPQDEQQQDEPHEEQQQNESRDEEQQDEPHDEQQQDEPHVEQQDEPHYAKKQDEPHEDQQQDLQKEDEERQKQEVLLEQEEYKRLAELQRQREDEERQRQEVLLEQEEQKRLAELQRQNEDEERQRQEVLLHQEEQKRLADLERQREDEERQRQEVSRHQEEQKRLAELQDEERQRQAALLQQQQHDEQEREQRQIQIRLEASKATSAVSAPTRLMDTGDLEDDPTPAGPITTQSSKTAAVSIPKALQEETSRGFEAVPDSFGFDDDDETESSSKAGADDKRRGKKKKKKRRNRPEEWARQAAEAERRKREEEELKDKMKDDVEIVYVEEKLDLDPSDPMYRTFAKIFDAFKIMEDVDDKMDKSEAEVENLPPSEEFKKVPKLLEEDDLIEEKDSDEDDDKPKLSKRKLKLLNRLSVAELKQLVPRPDVVEMHDVTARDPRLLVHLKSVRNSVPVPRHWCFKRKYLQGKRGFEKPPFNLPEFIKKTGIMEMRAALQEKEDAKNLKSKMREKVRPKLGKIDIDYQKLHDAFFKWQTKPRMSGHGDLYYEGKEFEIRLKEKKPGDLTDDLRTALGMPVGPNAFKVPPPWLIAMQRYGPPPSYPNLKIAGLNAAIPDGCAFGYHAGGWGKPPVDESGKPLYGDVFGTSNSAYSHEVKQEEIDTSLWGEMESDSEEEVSEEEEDEGEEEDESGGDAAATGLQTPVIEGLATPSGMSSVGASVLGQETPELLELRKKRIEAEMEGGETPNLFTVLPERRHERVGASMMGSTHTYDVKRSGASTDTGGIELALNPDEVDLVDTDAMRARAEAALRERQATQGGEDFSDMVAEHVAKQSSKRKRTTAGAGRDDAKGAKKYKEFKF